MCIHLLLSSRVVPLADDVVIVVVVVAIMTNT